MVRESTDSPYLPAICDTENPSPIGKVTPEPLGLVSDVIHRTGQSTKGIPIPLEPHPRLKKKRPFFGVKLTPENFAG
jgi:hypothetical protein